MIHNVHKLLDVMRSIGQHTYEHEIRAEGDRVLHAFAVAVAMVDGDWAAAVAHLKRALEEHDPARKMTSFSEDQWRDVMLAIFNTGNKWKDRDFPKPDEWSWERFEAYEKDMHKRGVALLELHKRMST